jgi:membrane protease YdiL (CAAX protease family)
VRVSHPAAWARVFGAVGIYVVIALGISRIIRRIGSDLKNMEARTSPVVTLLGLVANLAICGFVVLMLVWVDGRPVSDLGLDLDVGDAAVVAGFVAVSVVVAGLFLLRLRRTGTTEVHLNTRPDRANPNVGGAALTVAVLVAVALQEEVLYRGYVTVNLIHLGWGVVAGASIMLFVGIHLLTNRFTALQLTSWTVGAAVLVLAYLVSGSLWVAVALHLGMDLLNVVAFNIVGRFSLVTIEPPLDERSRVAYRLASSALIAVLLLGTYGARVATPTSIHEAEGAVQCHHCKP